MKIWKSHLFKKWLLTYLILIIISLFFLVGINTIYEKSIRNNLETLNNTYLVQVSHILDDEFASIDRLAYTMGFNKQLLNLLNMGQNLSANDRYDIMTAAKNLEVNARANRLVAHLNMYAAKPQFIIEGSSVYYDEYIDLYAKEAFNITGERLLQVLNENYNHTVIPLGKLFPDVEVTEDSLVYIQSLPVQYAGKPTGAFLFVIDGLKMKEIGENALPNGKLMVFNNEDVLIYANDAAFYTDPMALENVLEAKEGEITIDNKAYIIGIQKSATRHWTYVSMVPKDSYYAQLNRIHLIIFIMIGVFFIFNIFIAYYFSNRMYIPVKKMVESIQKGNEQPFDSEYDYIEKVLSHSREEQSKMRHDLQRQKYSLKNAFFTKLLRGYIQDITFIEQQMRNYNIVFDEDSYQLLLIRFYPIHPEESFSGNLSPFIIHNIFEEILGNYFNVQVGEAEDLIACIIDYDKNTITIQEIEEHIYTTIEMIEQSFAMKCLIGVSQPHQHISALPNAYQEGQEALSLAQLTGSRIITYYEDMIDMGARYSFSEEQEFHLIHSIKAGNVEQTQGVIEEVIQMNVMQQSLRLEYLQCMMYDLLGAILKSVNNEDFYEQLNEQSPIKQLQAAKDVEGMKKIILEVALAACQYGKQPSKEASPYSIEKQVNAYIEENYSDADLNGAKLGQVFNMTPAYLSKLYKKETGYSVLYTLNTTRIEAAKRLLEETELSVSDISGKVGYLYSNAFIRFFKKQTGITPGQYKAIKRDSLQ